MTAKELCSLVDIDSGETLEILWAPNDVSQEVASEMARPKIPGSSHSPSQFLQTDNQQIPFSLVVDAESYSGDERRRKERVDRARQFLLSLQYPRRSKRVDGAGKPLVLFVIPNNLTVRGYVDRVKISHEEWFDDLALRRFRAEIVLVEELNQRMTSGQVRRMRLSQGGPLGPGNFLSGRLNR